MMAYRLHLLLAVLITTAALLTLHAAWHWLAARPGRDLRRLEWHERQRNRHRAPGGTPQPGVRTLDLLEHDPTVSP